MFYRPLPVRDPYQLISVYSNANERGYGNFSYPEYAYLRDHTKAFESLAAHYSYAPLNVVTDGTSKEEQGSVVSANYFPMLGVQPLIGRLFLPEEDAVPDRNPVAVISYEMWKRRFDGDPAVLNKQIRINGTDFQIVGVLPDNFHGVRVGVPNHIWIPSMMLKVGYRWCDAFEVDCSPLNIIGRLAPGHKLEDAKAEMATIAAQLASLYPENNKDRGITLTKAIGVRPQDRDEMANQMRLLMSVAGLLLLIGCINIAGLLLARGTARRKEIAVRLSLGASRGRIARQLLTESLMLALLGGLTGFTLSLWAKATMFTRFYSIDAEGYRQFYDLSIDWRVMLFSFVISALTGLMFGLIPAIQGTKHDIANVLKGDAASLTPHDGNLRSALVIAQVALSLAMLVSAGLLLRSSAHIQKGFNFDPEHVALMRLRPRLMRYDPPKAQAYTREVVRRLKAMPGVQSVSLAKGVGLAWAGGGQVRVRRPVQTSNRSEDDLQVDYQEIAPRFLETLKIPLVQGREFNDSDRPDSPKVTIINETLAKKMWPDGSRIGSTLVIDDKPYQVVGVFKDARLHNALESPTPFLYVPYWQNKQQVDSRMVVRVNGDPQAMLPLLRQEIMKVDPDLPITEDMPMTVQVDGVYRPVLMASTVLSCSSVIALFMSAIGLYGVLAFNISQRIKEIGIRMALGAGAVDVVRLVAKQAMTVVLIGIAVGLSCALILARLLSNVLYGVSSIDLSSMLVAMALLVLVGLLACYIPARRATKVDPMTALRYE